MITRSSFLLVVSVVKVMVVVEVSEFVGLASLKIKRFSQHCTVMASMFSSQVSNGICVICNTSTMQHHRNCSILTIL
jgi:hypothetical protein